MERLYCYCKNCGFGKEEPISAERAEVRVQKDCTCGKYAWIQTNNKPI